MRREKLWTFLFSGLLAAVISCASVYCLVTGFRLQFDAGVGGLILFGLICGFASAGMLRLKHGGWVLAGLGILIGLLYIKDILFGAEVLLYRVTSLYHVAYGWEIWSWSGKALTGMAVDGVILPMAAVIAMLVSWVMCRRRRAIWALIPALLPLVACLVVTDTVPAQRGLFWLITGGVLLILTQTVRRRSAADGNRLLAILLIPCLLSSSLLFYLAPQEGYEANGNPLQNAILQWLEQLPFAPDHNGRPSGVLEGEEVDLSEISDREKDERIVLEVAGAESGLLYLRGQSYDVYTGNAWRVSDVQIKDMGWPKANGSYTTTIRVKTREVHDQLYLPYYADSSILRSSLIWGRLDNVHGVRSYQYNQYSTLKGDSKLDATMEAQCLDLPVETREAAEKLLENVLKGISLSYMKKAEVIGDYVRESAVYSLKTGKMPSGKEDLAIWFLEEGDTGYCVHFATAAVVLLRAAGIPARYVNGYVGYAKTGISTVITGDDAHAWVEYYVPSQGWKILEVTPSEGLPQAPGEDIPTTTVPTEPTGTTSVGTTEPSITTRPQTRPNSSATTADVESPSEPTKQSGGHGGQTPVKSKMPPWLLAIPGGLGGAALLIWLQFTLRCRRRRNQLRKGTPKQRAMARWRYVQRLSGLIKTLPPEELLALAEKAAFSQHVLKQAELHKFDQWIRDAEQELRKQPFGLLRRLIWAIE